jgi:hypothetical protein
LQCQGQLMTPVGPSPDLIVVHRSKGYISIFAPGHWAKALADLGFGCDMPSSGGSMVGILQVLQLSATPRPISDLDRIVGPCYASFDTIWSLIFAAK